MQCLLCVFFGIHCATQRRCLPPKVYNHPLFCLQYIQNRLEPPISLQYHWIERDQNSCCRFSGSLRRFNPFTLHRALGAAIIATCFFSRCHRHLFSGRQHAHQAQTLQVAGGIVGAILYMSSVNPINSPQSNQAKHGGMPCKCWIRVWFSYIHRQVRIHCKAIQYTCIFRGGICLLFAWEFEPWVNIPHMDTGNIFPNWLSLVISSWAHFGYERLLSNLSGLIW